MKRFQANILFLVLMFITLTANSGLSEELTAVTPDWLKARIDHPEAMIIDVRQPKHWLASDAKVPGAVHIDPNEFDLWMGGLPKDKQLVLY